MPAAIPIAISAATSLAGAKIASNASKSAAAQQQAGATAATGTITDASNKALDFYKTMWGQSQGLMQPYVNSGNMALSTLNKGMGFNPSASMPVGGLAPQTITVVAPDGSRQARPAIEKDHWLSKGAQVL